MSEAEIKALIDETARNGRKLFKRFFDYTWITSFKKRYFDKREKMIEETRVVEVYPRAGWQAERVLSINGKDVSQKNRAKKDRKLGEELAADEEKRQRQAAALEDVEVESRVADRGRLVRVSFYDFARACNFTNPRRAILNARPAILLDFAPRPSFAPEDSRRAHLAHLAGTLWIDEADKQFARLEARLSPQAREMLVTQQTEAVMKSKKEKKPLPAVQPNFDEPVLVIEQARTPDGMWIVRLMHLDATLAPAVFNGNRAEWIFESYDFKRFDSGGEFNSRAVND